MAALSKRAGSFLLMGSLAVMLIALFAPLPELSHPGKSAKSNDASCPLGYTGSDEGVELPADHPPVPGHMQPSPDAKEFTVKREEVPDDSRLFVNARVWTGDPQMPSADAFRVSAAGKIIEVGSASELRAKAGGYSQTVDMQGRHVIPGFVDAHAHLMMGGLQMQQLDLSGVSSKEELREAVGAAVVDAASSADGAAGEGDGDGGAGDAPNQWVFGWSWTEHQWGGALPDASWIDAVSGSTPVALVRADLHSALVNSAALLAAGITGSTPDPPGGSIDRSADGNPTGLLRDSAMAMVLSSAPPPSLEDRKKALEDAMDYFLARGITQVHDMGWAEFLHGPEASWRDLDEVLMSAANQGALRLRVHAAVPLSTWAQLSGMVKALGSTHPGGFLSWGMAKAFVDGSLGSRTALMSEPYLDTGTTGVAVTNLTQLREDILAADAAGLQVAVHAIGDRAVDEVVSMYAEARKRNGPRSSGLPRHRVEHVQHVAGRQSLLDLKDAGVYAVTNPLHLPWDKQAMAEALGPERSLPDRAYPFRSLLEVGVPMAFGSDWPVVGADALGGIYAAVHRRARSHVESGENHQASSSGPDAAGGLSPTEAFMAHTDSVDTSLLTVAASMAGGGRISVGQPADFAVLSGDPMGIGVPDAAVHPVVLETYVGGKRMYTKPPDDAD